MVFCNHDCSRFRPHYAGEIENTTTSGHFGFFFLRKLRQENHVIIVTSSFSKSSVFKIFPDHTKTQSDVSKFLWFEERFRKTPFSWWISVDSRPNRKKQSCVFKFLRRNVEVVRKMFPLFSNFQQAETTRRHEQVLEHVKEKVNEILNFKKLNHAM